MPVCGFIARGYICATGPELNGYKGNYMVYHAKNVYSLALPIRSSLAPRFSEQ